MSSLLQISIGPVQSFIKGARRTRDLKFSSSFLSTLARTAARTLAEKCGADNLIFPAMSAGQLDDVPNKILVYVEKDIPPDQLARLVKTKINERVKQISDDMFRKISKGRFDDAGAKRQIADLVEYVWAAVRYDQQTDDYAYARQKLEALMAARKNTRDFAPVSWGSSQPKSSIDGQLESVIEESEYPYIRDVKNMSAAEKLQVSHQISQLRRIFDVGPHEKLSGVDLLKRHGTIEKEEKTFPSTSHLAALPFLTGLNTLSGEKHQQVDEWKKQYISQLRSIDISLLKSSMNHSLQLDILPEEYRANTYWDKIYALDEYDGALLYPERFPNVVGDAQVFRDAHAEFQEATNILEEFLQTIHMRPNPYYGLLVADGDSMGKMIDHQAKSGMKRHQELSTALAKFAISVREIIQKHAGIRIYSGGDDVVAMLPLHTAVECAHALAEEFREKLKGFTDKDEHSPTLSAGLAIIHHLHPLGEALAIARAAEGRAKSGKKNALAITLQKRGGPPCFVRGRWDTFVPRLQYQIKLCQDELLPSGLAYELEEIALRLETERDEKPEQDGKAKERQEKPKHSPPHVQYAALRTLQRKLAEVGRTQEKEEAALALYALKRMLGLIDENAAEGSETPAEAFEALRKKLGVKAEQTERLDKLRALTAALDQFQPVRVEELANELVVARFFAEAGRLALGNKKGAKQA